MLCIYSVLILFVHEPTDIRASTIPKQSVCKPNDDNPAPVASETLVSSLDANTDGESIIILYHSMFF